MKKEKISEIITNIDDKYIDEAAYFDNKVLEQDRNKADIIRIGKNGGHRLSRVAVALIAFAGVLALGGGVVWAMTASPLKDRFFKNSDKEFEQVYTEVGKEFLLGNLKVVYEGSSFEEAVEHGYVHLSLWDLEGNPVDRMEYRNDLGEEDFLTESYELRRNISSVSINVADDVIRLVTLYSGTQNMILDNNNIYIKFSRRNAGLFSDASDFNDVVEFYKDKPFRFMVLSEEQWSNLRREVGKLNADELITYTPVKDEESGLYTGLTPNYPKDYVQPEVMSILEKYDLCDINAFESELQIIEMGNMKLEIGRMSMLINYNKYDCPIDEFIFRRENGTEFKAFLDKSLWKFEENLDNVYVIDGSGASISDDGSVTAILIYGFILDENEKVTIEVDHEIYE